MRIAVVGTGISGLGAAWLLHRRHEVHVFERLDRLGGHTNTVTVRHEGHDVPIDTGFIVYNEPTYPNLTRFFDELEIETQPSDMSYACRCERHDVEYAGNPSGIFADRRSLSDPGHLAMVRDIARFNRLGRRLLDDPRTAATRLGSFLGRMGFSDGFAQHYLLPMTGAIWSSGTQRVEDFPLQTLLRFFDNHGLLGITTHHPWRTVTGGARTYVDRIAGDLDHVHCGDPVVRVTRAADGVRLETASGTTSWFDKVVIAAHADEALGMLTDPSPDEKELLGAWDYTTNHAWLHTDMALMPHREAARASWNSLVMDCEDPGGVPSLTYDLSRLQSLPGRYLVTLNPPTRPAPEHVLRHVVYTHPVFTPESVETQSRLSELSGRRHTLYAGAYHRYGFHEDGLVSALRAVRKLGVTW